MSEYNLEELPKLLRTKSNMIYLGEKIAFGSECELMDVAANEIEHLRELKSNHFTAAIRSQDKVKQLEAENNRLKDTIMELKEMQRIQTNWICAELGLNPVDAEQIVKDAIVATTTEMP